MPDEFQTYSDTVFGSARDAFAVTPNDSTDLLEIPKALYVGATGSLVVTLVDDSASVTFVAVPAGALLPIRPRRVHASGTTAASILALY
jgi:hypothetical protein